VSGHDPAFRIRQSPGNVSEGSVVSSKKQATFGTLANNSLGSIAMHNRGGYHESCRCDDSDPGRCSPSGRPLITKACRRRRSAGLDVVDH
jgi:hypothetical protein